MDPLCPPAASPVYQPQLRLPHSPHPRTRWPSRRHLSTTGLDTKPRRQETAAEQEAPRGETLERVGRTRKERNLIRKRAKPKPLWKIARTRHRNKPSVNRNFDRIKLIPLSSSYARSVPYSPIWFNSASFTMFAQPTKKSLGVHSSMQDKRRARALRTDMIVDETKPLPDGKDHRRPGETREQHLKRLNVPDEMPKGRKTNRVRRAIACGLYKKR